MNKGLLTLVAYPPLSRAKLNGNRLRNAHEENCSYNIAGRVDCDRSR